VTGFEVAAALSTIGKNELGCGLLDLGNCKPQPTLPAFLRPPARMDENSAPPKISSTRAANPSLDGN
jgi:hypothetical protein